MEYGAWVFELVVLFIDLPFKIIHLNYPEYQVLRKY